jgi:transposase
VVATTRRSWSKQQKRAIVAEIDAGGATLSEVARRHGIHSSLLFRWRKTLGSVMGAVPAIASPSLATSTASEPRFMPVMLPPPSPLAQLPPTTAPGKPSTIEIALDNGRAVRVAADVDTSALVRIIEALEKSR